MIATRHELIHRARMDLRLTDDRLRELIYELDEAITRVQKTICRYHGWPMARGWYLGRERTRAQLAADQARLTESPNG